MGAALKYSLTLKGEGGNHVLKWLRHLIIGKSYVAAFGIIIFGVFTCQLEVCLGL